MSRRRRVATAQSFHIIASVVQDREGVHVHRSGEVADLSWVSPEALENLIEIGAVMPVEPGEEESDGDRTDD